MILDKELHIERLSAKGAQLFLQSQRISLKNRWGVLTWTRPVSVVVKGDGELKKIPIVDITRRITFSLYSLAMLFALFHLTSFRRKRSRKNE